MSQTLKLLVLAFLQNLPESPFEQFNKAFELYKQCPNKNRSAEMSYNRRGYNEQSLKNLLYDLQKLNNISDVELHDKKVLDEKSEEKPFYVKLIEAFEKLHEQTQVTILQASAVIQKFSDLIESSDLLKELVESGSEAFEKFKEENPEVLMEDGALALADLYQAYVSQEPTYFDNFKIEGLPEVLEQGTDDDKKVKFLNELSEKAAAVISSVTGEKEDSAKIEELTFIREEFPFLNEEGCPDVIYVIVGRRIAAYRKYQALHAKLQEVNAGTIQVTEEEKLQLTIDCDAAFSENRLLWEELEHYAKTKEFLGKHPLFREDNLKKEVDAMSQKELLSLVSSSSKYFHDQKKALEKYKDNPKKIDEINARIADRQYKLALVNSKLGVNAGEKK